jgi:hypothetical protein
MTYVVLFVFCIVFIELSSILNVREQAADMLRRSRDAAKVLASSEMHDDAKEAFVRRASLAMLRATAALTLKLAAIAAALLATYLAMISLFPALEAGLLQSFASPTAIIGATAAAAGYVWVRNVVVKQL